jgi:hypothetical protein
MLNFISEVTLGTRMGLLMLQTEKTYLYSRWLLKIIKYRRSVRSNSRPKHRSTAESEIKS